MIIVMIKVNIMHYDYYYTHAVVLMRWFLYVSSLYCTMNTLVYQRCIVFCSESVESSQALFYSVGYSWWYTWMACLWKITTGMILVAKNLRVTYSMIYNSKNHFLFHLHTLTKAVGLIIILSRREERKGGEREK